MESLVSSVISAIPTATLAVTEGGRIAAMNPKARDLFGAGILQRPFVQIFRNPLAIAAFEAVTSGQPARSVDMPGPVASGRKSLFRLHFARFENGDSQPLLVTFEDLSDQVAANDMRRDFVSNLSHELRTPLTAILGFVETLAGPAKNDPAARDHFLGIMQRETERMSRLVNDLLTLSRVEDEERRRPGETVDMVSVVKSAVSILDQTASRAGVRIETVFPVGPAPVQGQEEQLRQVLLNLTENAIKYGGKGGLVTIDVTQDRPDWVQIVVADKGEGIAAHHIPRLTERFYRVDSHRSREVGGTGLGLAIVKHIVNRHRGRLGIESEPGQGTRMTVSLPAVSNPDRLS